MHLYRKKAVKMILCLAVLITLRTSGGNKPIPVSPLTKKIEQLRYENDQKLMELENKLKEYELVPKR